MAWIVLLCHINCDHVVDVDREPAGGARLEGQSRGRRLGGAGANAGSALVAAGHRVSVACSLGNDERGDWLQAQAAECGLQTDLIQRYRGTTPELMILRTPANQGERTILTIDRSRRPAYAVASLSKVLTQCDCLFVNSPSRCAAPLMARALEQPRLLVAAQMPRQPAATPTATPMLRPAHILLASASDLTPGALADPWAAGRSVAGAALRWVIITDGAKGAKAYDGGDRKPLAVPAYPARAVDTTGAGDIFAAGVLDALLAGQAMPQALANAARWAAFAVESAESTAPKALRRYLTAGLAAE